jgi:hypothetical protein
MQLIFGARKIDRVVADADQLLLSYRKDDGYPYLDYQPTSPSNYVVPEDLAVTLLVNSRATGKAFKSIQKHGPSQDLSNLPAKPLELTTQAERHAVAAIITQVANWPGFAASLATKVLHKKYPGLIPILDNKAIFGAYMNRYWPQNKSPEDSIKSSYRIKEALDWIATDLLREENQTTWPQLQAIEPRRTLIQIFDSVWWMYFRKLEPARSYV